MKHYLTLIILFILIKPALSQQDPQYSQYMFNTLVINPAYAGYRETNNISLLHRDQWSGFAGAPKTQSLIADGAFGIDKKVGLGISLVNDKAGLQRQTSAHANYAYRIPVGADARLALGISIGLGQFSLNSDDAQIQDESDPNFIDKQTYFVPDARFGVHYSTSKFYAGLSATDLISGSIDYQQVGKNTITRQGRHYFLTAGGLFELNSNFKLKPSFLIREDTKGPTNLDLNSFLLIKESIWVGGSYRTGINLWKKTGWNNSTFSQNSVVGLIEAFVLKNLRVGYSYDYSLSDLADYSNGTHEFSLGLILNSNKKSVTLSPRYF
ncbi:type IX secretion system membrane protein PorP/SprF [Pedobacter sp. P351]|uniref:PorP/SprF family type IX secretion system membrane protein n=1 Tax=Pedobacter superstes TaxID=3133441 RepID=UPI0030A1BAB2